MKYKATIIYPPSIDYKFMYQRPQQMMKAFAQWGCNVIFMNPANIFHQASPVEAPFAELPNFKVVGVGTDITRFLKGKIILWMSLAFQHKMIDLVKPNLAVFDSVDAAENEFEMLKKYIPAMERKADLIFSTAKVMYNEHEIRRGNRGGVHILPNAADFDHFKYASRLLGERPSDLPDIKGKPLVGYYGAIHTWLDLKLVYSIADYYPVVMIGASALYNIPISHPNVTVLFMKDYRELPLYLSWFDCAIIPFKLTKMIKGCDPIKFYEYLSAGKPVVASDMEELRKFKGLYYPATVENAPAMIAKALEENNVGKVIARQKVAQANSWKARALFALKIIEKIFQEKALKKKTIRRKRTDSVKYLKKRSKLGTSYRTMQKRKIK